MGRSCVAPRGRGGGGQVLVGAMAAQLPPRRGPPGTVAPVRQRGSLNRSRPSRPLGATRWRRGHGAPIARGAEHEAVVSVRRRAAEWQQLAKAWDSVRDGGRNIVLVRGEPGAGKTASSRSSPRQIVAEGGIVLFGTCREDGVPPFGAIVDALEHLLAHRLTSTSTKPRPNACSRAPSSRNPKAAESSRRCRARSACNVLRRHRRPARRCGPSGTRPAGARRPPMGVPADSATRRAPPPFAVAGPALHSRRIGTRPQTPRRVHRRARRSAPRRRHRAGPRPRARRLGRARVRRTRCGRRLGARSNRRSGSSRARPTGIRSSSANSGTTSSTSARSFRPTGGGVSRSDLDALTTPESVRSVVGRRLDRLPGDAASCSKSRRSRGRRSRSICSAARRTPAPSCPRTPRTRDRGRHGRAGWRGDVSIRARPRRERALRATDAGAEGIRARRNRNRDRASRHLGSDLARPGPSLDRRHPDRRRDDAIAVTTRGRRGDACLRVRGRRRTPQFRAAVRRRHRRSRRVAGAHRQGRDPAGEIERSRGHLRTRSTSPGR